MLTRISSRPVDFFVSLAIFLGALAAAYSAAQYPGAAGRWPLVIMLLLAVLCGYQLVLFLFGNRAPTPLEEAVEEAAAAPRATTRVVASVVLILGFVILAPILGLFAAAAVFLTAHMLTLGVRPFLLALASGIGVAAVLYLFFGWLLGVSMPDGLII